MDTSASPLSQEDFEEIARAAARTNESVRLEFLDGKIREKAVPDGVHQRIYAWLLGLCMQANQGWMLYPDHGMRVEAYRKGNARPDGVLLPVDAVIGDGEWARPDGALMVVEITSRDSDTNQRDRVDKPAAYAAAAIPVYLLVDRGNQSVKVHSEPEGGRYAKVNEVAFGKSVSLPEPVGFELDTAPLLGWAG
ncbi:Uma2 family endonuclease [Streptomyces sp. SPB074]|uniref:Uma2 family endonuclease n=1 Tax=Streptomyces sp. (strain SPB074) TaxID=465543 RepID=UPI00017F101D|nr:Uma2 family endonuclease [Streptomyces sp. SPB074]